MSSGDLCTRCRADMAGARRINLAEGTRLYGVYMGRRCASCNWANSEQARSHIDLNDVLKSLPEALAALSNTNDPVRLIGNLRATRTALLSAVRNDVFARPDLAIMWLRYMLGGITGEHTNSEDRVVLAVQQVYACLLARGPIWLLDPFPDATKPPAGWFDRISELALAAVMISSVIREFEANSWRSTQLADGILDLEANERTRWGLEINLNNISSADEHSLERLEEVAAVERSVFGTSATDLLLLLQDTDWLSRETRIQVVDDDNLIVIDLDSNSPIVQAVRRHLLLTAEKWKAHAVPSFLFADRRRGLGTQHSLVTQASELDWLRYAPVLHGNYGRPQNPTPLGFTTPGLIRRALTRAAGTLAGRLAMAVTRAREDRASSTASALARDVHTAFEAASAEACVTAGLTAVHGVADLDGKALPCGEIDVLAWTVGPDGPVVLVVECKNTDMVFYKDFGIDQIHDTFLRATKQAQRKGSWIASNWTRLAAFFDWPYQSPTVVAVVVTRTVNAPWQDGGVPILRLPDLSDLARALRLAHRSQWPLNLAAAVMPSQ